jgi:hypothetical protein
MSKHSSRTATPHRLLIGLKRRLTVTDILTAKGAACSSVLIPGKPATEGFPRIVVQDLHAATDARRAARVFLPRILARRRSVACPLTSRADAL